jgi:hypothetical protein
MGLLLARINVPPYHNTITMVAVPKNTPWGVPFVAAVYFLVVRRNISLLYSNLFLFYFCIKSFDNTETA